MKYLFLASLSFLLLETGSAQNTPNRYSFVYSDLPKVWESGDSLENAWAGGVNYVQYSPIDLDLDGTKDLVVFDRSGNRLLPFLTRTLNGQKRYQYAPDYASLFPDLEYWVLLVDYNCDGKEDIFAAHPLGMVVYENTSTANLLQFTYALGASPYLLTQDNGTSFNLYNSTADIPAIFDVDGDNAIDIFTFGLTAGVEYHKNTQPCGLDYELWESCWGHFIESGATNKLLLQSCFPPAVPGNGPAISVPEEEKHAGSTLLMLDLNGNGLNDLLLGDVSFNNAVAAYNTGTTDTADVLTQDTLYPAAHPVDLFVFPAFFYTDVDFDNVKDLLVSPNASSGAKNINGQWFYKNNGSNTNPNFSFTDSAFIQGEMIDIGENSVPALVDINNDGRKDLVISTYGTFQASGTYKSGLHYYRNTSTPGGPLEFTLVSKDLSNLSSIGFGQSLIPAFGDLNGNGFPDMILGAEDGTLHYLIHNQNSLNPGYTLQQANIQNIDVGSNSAPFLFDLDGDGDLDLLVGEAAGNINYFENQGSTTSFNFVLINDYFGGINVTGTSLPGHSVPYMFEANGQANLAVGSSERGILLFDSLDNALSQPAEVTATLGTGTTQSSDFEQSLLGTSKRTGRNQILFTAAELKSQGLDYGMVKAIHFQVASSGNPTLTQGVSIKMKNTNSTSLTSFETGTTQVFEWIIGPFQGWNRIELQRPFFWDGKSNLLVEFCFSRNIPGPDVVFYGSDPGFPSNAYGDITNWNTVTSNGCNMPYKATTNFRPNFKFSIVPAVIQTDVMIRNGQRNAAAIAKLDNDTLPDLILGNTGGGLIYYKGIPFNNMSVPEASLVKKGLRIFPNPTSGKVFLEAHEFWNGILDIEVWSVDGRMVHKEEIPSSSRIELDLGHLPQGVYVVKVKDEKHNFVGRVLLRN
ncbi:MAG: T9SS type A sorting domain-containing protein [Bacteroidota bacterium]|nr:T9SS type A sorting domain-containing protein [Bacteroidota bacterium]